MAIKSSTFGRVELSGKDAAQCVQHMNEDKANPLALAALARGRAISEKIKKGEAFRAKHRMTLKKAMKRAALLAGIYKSKRFTIDAAHSAFAGLANNK